MFTEKDRENLNEQLLAQLKKSKNVKAVVLVGSLAGEYDEYSDVDLSAIVEDGCVEKTWKLFEKHIKRLSCFKYFKQIYSDNSMLYGVFMNTGLEIDLGFVDLNYYINRVKAGGKTKILYVADDFKFTQVQKTKIRKDNINELVLERSNDMWYHFKNAIFALKRNRLFRVLNEIEEMRNHIIQIYAINYKLEFKHYKTIDLLPVSVKNLIKKDIPHTVDYKNLKHTIINLLNHFCKILNSYGRENDAKSYNKVFTELIKDVNL